MEITGTGVVARADTSAAGASSEASESRAERLLRDVADAIARRDAPRVTQRMLREIMDAAVTPDAILACVGTMVRGMDAQIASRVTGMRDTQQDAAELTDRLAALNHLKAEGAAVGDGNIAADERVTLIDGSTATGAEAAASLGIPVDGGLLTADRLTAAISETQARLQDLNSGNELKMIELQTIVQQRTSILNLATNLLKGMDDATKNIVGNVR